MRSPSLGRLAAIGLATSFVLPGLALAQQAPAPGWAQGRPDSMAGSSLAPHAPKLTATPADQLPTAALRVPQGFKVELWASGAPGARMMTESPNGTVFVGTRTLGRVYAISEEGGQRRVRTIASQLTDPNGVAVRDGALYVIAINRVLRFDGIEGKLDAPGTPVDMTAAFGLPSEAHHGWKFAAFGPDGRLYMNIGVPCNICDYNRATHALIVSFNPDGSGRRIEAQGIRNSVGFDWNPQTRELWATNNGRDWAGNDTPEDTLHRIRRSGEDFGFPYCAHGWRDPAITSGPATCAEFAQPVALLGPHTAALGMRFYTGTQFPEAYRNQIFIARRGSWNRERLSGYDVVVAELDANGAVIGVEPFLTGLRDEANNRFLGRPVDVLVRRDGSLLVSDEQNGAIYRISYGN
ncbi:PQQ-dependent sugar dehydrogenase [Siccirubricoccus sp. KC 17139]|uniref:PQQ-dependent sugar dehydrogenase n=1 Tax=Siccirubricoccus soli TaxID=2899147 RepID=A0ABT1D8S9_9PROT|nr:PQQ-dependent sugar dehydrogenase [Siccirubricoccus soli]MCO6418323.1 PQQ-dependent sugar dehydrogenase [Siccirubricoccus soli]MCP2684458.1 PQQ-dependent sugar dehydrogenase [Siccirubricoccus soli]